MAAIQTQYQLAAFTAKIIHASIDMPNVLNAATGLLMRALLLPVYPAAWFFVWQLERKLRHTFKADYAVPKSDQEYLSLRHFLDRVDEVVKTIQAIEQKSSADMPPIAKSLVKLKPLFIRERQAIVAALNSIERTAVVGDELLHLIPEAELWATRSKGYQYRF